MGPHTQATRVAEGRTPRARGRTARAGSPCRGCEAAQLAAPPVATRYQAAAPAWPGPRARCEPHPPDRAVAAAHPRAPLPGWAKPARRCLKGRARRLEPRQRQRRRLLREGEEQLG
jgi:hypothetical protein